MHLPARTEHSVKNRWYSLTRQTIKDDSTAQSSDEASNENVGKESPESDQQKSLVWYPPYFPDKTGPNCVLPFPFYVADCDLPFFEIRMGTYQLSANPEEWTFSPFTQNYASSRHSC
jgi:hypothetical protein